MIGFDAVVGVPGGVVKCIRQELCNDSEQGVGPIGGDLGRLAMGSDHRGEELRGGLEVSLSGHEHVNGLPILVNGPVDVSPGPRHLHVRLVNEPASTHAVPAGLGRLDQQWRESLDPPVQGHVVDLDPAFGEQFFQVPVGQSVALVQAHG
jgi:hypothetical protein